jgi:hypothetical protein
MHLPEEHGSARESPDGAGRAFLLKGLVFQRETISNTAL